MDRPLTDRGVRNSYDMAERFAKAKIIPEKIYSSTGIRALHTAVIMTRVWNLADEALSIRESLYMAGHDEIDQILSEIPSEINSVAIFGHNPAFTDFANRYLKEQLANLPTAGMVVLTFEADSWLEISRSNLIDEVVDCPSKK